MGAIGHQPPRRRHAVEYDYLDSHLQLYADLAKKRQVSLADVIALKHALELERANDIAIDDGDNRDEHAGGYTAALRDVSWSWLERSARDD